VFLDVLDRVEAERRLVQAARLAPVGEMVAGVARQSRNALQQIRTCSGLPRWRLQAVVVLPLGFRIEETSSESCDPSPQRIAAKPVKD
jgi:hypothetical protein